MDGVPLCLWRLFVRMCVRVQESHLFPIPFSLPFSHYNNACSVYSYAPCNAKSFLLILLLLYPKAPRLFVFLHREAPRLFLFLNFCFLPRSSHVPAACSISRP